MIYTIGHPTCSAEDFLALLQATTSAALSTFARFRVRAGIRTSPRTRLRIFWRSTASPTSTSVRWEACGSRARTRRTAGGEFAGALDRLVAFGSERQAAVMCAEAKWWQCHRRLTADALVARVIDVRHIMGHGSPPAHQLTPFARVTGSQVHYPALV